MRGPKAAELMLSETEKAELERLVKGHNTPQQLAVRGRMILLAAEGKGNAQIGRELHMCADTIRLWRMRWIGLQAMELADLSVRERLKDDARPGRPAEITAEQTCKIVALACDGASEHPMSHWTGRELAEEAITRGIVKHLSPRHAMRLLKRGLSNPI